MAKPGNFHRESFLEILRRPGPFWFDELGPTLAHARWETLEAGCQLNKFNYGTTRVLEGNPFAERQVIGNLPAPVQGTQIVVEVLPSRIVERYQGHGLNFYSTGEFDLNLLDFLTCALRLISLVRGVAIAVSSVLSVVHVLKPEFPEYDVSYSEPSVPFSVFVGVTSADQPYRNLRLAEGILHECMHLQLTLIEEQAPLLKTEIEHHHSPWRRTLRPTRGVLHALYVFRVIQDFFAEPILLASLTADERSYISRRVDEIEVEIGEVGNLAVSRDLTATGRAVVERLQAGNRSPSN